MLSTEDILQALPDARREAVATFLQTELGACVFCSEPVLVTDKRKLEKQGFAHLHCSA